MFSNSSAQLMPNNLIQPISIASTPGSNSQFKEQMAAFSRNASGRDSHVMKIDSLTNSRRDSRGGSKRKIFSKGNNET